MIGVVVLGLASVIVCESYRRKHNNVQVSPLIWGALAVLDLLSPVVLVRNISAQSFVVIS